MKRGIGAACLGLSLGFGAGFAVISCPLQAQTTTDTLTGPGDGSEIRALLVPRVESVLSSRIAGRITRLEVVDGQRFDQDQLLVAFDCALHRAHLEKAEAEYVIRQETHRSNLRLREHNAVSKLDVAVSAAEVKKAQAELSLNQARLELCEVKAPFSGRVAQVEVNRHESVTEGQKLMEILDDSRLKMELYVPSHWLTWLAPGAAFTVRVDETGQDYAAGVTGIGARVDPVSQTVAVYAELEQHHPELLAGMSGVARFDIPE